MAGQTDMDQAGLAGHAVGKGYDVRSRIAIVDLQDAPSNLDAVVQNDDPLIML